MLKQSPQSNRLDPRGSTTSWGALVLGAVAGIVALLHPAADYVTNISPSWFVLVGIAVAVVARMFARTTGQRSVALLVTTVLLLPTAFTLSLSHLFRAVGAIPFPVDPISACVSIGAAIALLSLWFVPNPLRPSRVLRIPVPAWVPLVGIAASLSYPILKTLWAFGVDFAAPAGTVGVIDATFVGTVAVALAAVPALIIAMRWWNRPAPRWTRPVALVGGLILLSLGVSGLWAVARSSAGDAATGLLVYGGWLVWGAAILATAGRLSPTLNVHHHPSTEAITR